MFSPGTNLLVALACCFTLACGASPAPGKTEVIGGASNKANPCGNQPCADNGDQTGPRVPDSHLPAEEIASGALVVFVQEDGQLLVNDKVIEDAELDRIFLENFTRDPNTQVVLSAAPSVSHSLVVSVMDRAKKAGLSRLAISTADSPEQ